MNFYLVKGTVYRTEYMNDEESFEDMRLVRAKDALEAHEKYENYWRDKTIEYSVYYRAMCDVLETVE